MKNKKLIPTMGLAMTMFMSQPAYAKETNNVNVNKNEEKTYKVEFKKESSLENSMKNMFSKKLKDIHFEETSVDQNNKKTLVYEADNYTVEVQGLNVSKEGQQVATVSLKDEKTLSTIEKKEVLMNVEDTQAPTISGRKEYTITNDNDLDLTKSLQANDNKDGNMDIQIDGEIDYDINGTYTVYATATDDKGNSKSEEITVTVDKKGQTSKDEQTETNDFSQKIADAALAQVGRNQDCTMLATNSLAAVGINFHGWPADYAQLGEWTNNPVPGDLIIYQGHIAVYIGNGQAVHGGWLGNQTVVSSVSCTNALIGYIHVGQ